MDVPCAPGFCFGGLPKSSLERCEQGSSSGFPGARGTLGADSRARGVGAVHAEGPHGLWAQSRGQR